MRILIVCDALKKFIGEDEKKDKKVANYITKFIKEYDEAEGVYLILLNRVLEKQTRRNSDLNAAIISDGDGSTEIPPNIYGTLRERSNAVVFRKGLSAFDESDPDLKMVFKSIEDFCKASDKKLAGITFYFVSKDKVQNYAVIKEFKQKPEFSEAELSYIFLR